MSRLSLFSTSAEPLPLTALLFLLTRMNFFVLLNRYQLFSLRVSSVVKVKYKDIVSRRMQGKIKHSSLDFNAFCFTKEDNAFRQFCDAVRKGDVAKREIILRELHPELLDNLTTQGLTSLDLLKTPATGKVLVPLPYTLPPISADTLKTPTRCSKLPKSTNTLKTLPSCDLLPKSTKERDNAAALAHAELEAMRRLNAEITKDVAAVASCILDPNYRQAVRLFNLDFNALTTLYNLIPFLAT
ncbi:hypothetical protein K504DRAFT_454933 [Pleomassaria siparia CBS 279.74]|uniref:Uncharacterized protein n=1 Tax=Pleomassaria siparia CBS 279.74 TaxID=1314801 RepID=A0A6G1K8E3_9PLEO|nr:hypothetical protein K504DRAFT_454933 [Pleomassaria siparia CBS 279.74]